MPSSPDAKPGSPAACRSGSTPPPPVRSPASSANLRSRSGRLDGKRTAGAQSESTCKTIGRREPPRLLKRTMSQGGSDGPEQAGSGSRRRATGRLVLRRWVVLLARFLLHLGPLLLLLGR